MSQPVTPADLGESDLKVAGFQLWVHERPYPESQDYYTGNWLRVTAHCGASGASVWAQGTILMVTDIHRFAFACAAMLAGEVKSAVLDPVEPDLEVSLTTSDRLGHLLARVEITPDYQRQDHRFEFELDQSYLPGIIQQCARIVREYPIRGQHGRGGG